MEQAHYGLVPHTNGLVRTLAIQSKSALAFKATHNTLGRFGAVDVRAWSVPMHRASHMSLKRRFGLWKLLLIFLNLKRNGVSCMNMSKLVLESSQYAYSTTCTYFITRMVSEVFGTNCDSKIREHHPMGRRRRY